MELVKDGEPRQMHDMQTYSVLHTTACRGVDNELQDDALDYNNIHWMNLVQLRRLPQITLDLTLSFELVCMSRWPLPVGRFNAI